MTRSLSLHEAARRQVGTWIIDGSLRSIAGLGKLHPRANPAEHRVEVLRDVAYRSAGRVEDRLDVYRPLGLTGRAPVVLYIHGGGFRILSKDTHWVMGLAFARRGYVVFNVNYRLAPRHPFPAALEDVSDAFGWVVSHAAEYGGDVSRLIVSGESAGANLAASLSLMTCYRRGERFARAVWDREVVPRAVMPACGILQVTNHERFQSRKKLSPWLADRIAETCQSYIGASDRSGPGGIELADPLVMLEQGAPPDRPLPPFFAGVGTRDPLLDDTRRLKSALDRMGVPCDVRFYPGEIHAFEALVWRPEARRFWQHTYEFLDQHGLGT